MPSIILCADTESIRRPDLIGLAGENLARQAWLRLFTSGEDIRGFLRTDQNIEEAWIAGSDDIDSINLAATLKQDCSNIRVCLLAFEETGSLKSRASAAGVDALLARQAFVERYAEAKRRFSSPRREEQFGLSAFEEGIQAQQHFVPEFTQRKESQQAHSLPYGERHERAAAGWADMQRDSKARQGIDAARVSQGVSNVSHVKPREQSSAGCFEVSSLEKNRMTRTGNPAFLLPVVSGSGGAGKSSIAALSALFAQGLGYKTLLIDFDLQFGDLREVMGMPEALAIDEALRAPERLARLEPDGLQPALLAAPKHLEDAESIARDIPRLLDVVQGGFEVVVANTGSAWAEEHALLLERSSKALFLVDQRPSSLRACRHALDLCARCGIATGPFLFAVNRCAKGALLTSIDVSCALRGASAIELREGGREVEELLGAGQPLDLIAAKNDLCTSLEHALVDILPGCEGRTLRVAQTKDTRSERRFGRGRRRKKGE